MQAIVRRGIVRLLLKVVIIGGLSTVSLQVLWPRAPSTPPQPVPGINRSSQVLLALDMVVLSVKEYVRTGDPARGIEFETSLKRCVEMLAQLESAGAEERHVAMQLEGQLLRIEALGRQLVSIPNPRGDYAVVAQVNELVELRDGTVLTVDRLHEADVRRIEQQTDQATSLAYRLGGPALAAAGLCLAGGVGLARFCVG